MAFYDFFFVSSWSQWLQVIKNWSKVKLIKKLKKKNAGPTVAGPFCTYNQIRGPSIAWTSSPVVHESPAKWHQNLPFSGQRSKSPQIFTFYQACCLCKQQYNVSIKKLFLTFFNVDNDYVNVDEDFFCNIWKTDMSLPLASSQVEAIST